MFGLVAAAKQHRSIFYKLILETGKDVIVRGEPAAPTGTLTDADRALGIQATTATVYPEAIVKGIITGPMLIPLVQENPGLVAPIGLIQQSDIIIRCKLSDVLVDPLDVYGPNSFDVAHDVVIGKNVFKVVATDRSGLPPLDPYICWVGLKSSGVTS
jgi:hypothetical protein